MSQVLFYLIVKPLSLLPLPILYLFSDAMYLLLYRLAGFRKKVVWNNLLNAFPDQSPTELRAVMKAFYRHFCDLIVESIRMISMTEEEARGRCPFRNPEVLDAHYRAGKSVILTGGHYNSWELMAMVFDMQAPHQAIAAYTPLSNSFFEGMMKASREKFGTALVPKNDIGDFIKRHKDQRNLYILVADQSPTYAKKVYWTRFLNQETAIAFGPEKLSKLFDMPVVFCHIYKLSRGRYEIVLEDVEPLPKQAPHGSITEAHVRLLEKDIMAAPQYWLWTHRRWKRQRREDE
jgi:KDO2-lipid IV(A) lauroyltransferase